MFLPHRNLSAAANKKEPILGLLEDLDVEVEPSRPVDWTVSISSLTCAPVLYFSKVSSQKLTPADAHCKHLQVIALLRMALLRGQAQESLFFVSSVDLNVQHARNANPESSQGVRLNNVGLALFYIVAQTSLV